MATENPSFDGERSTISEGGLQSDNNSFNEGLTPISRRRAIGLVLATLGGVSASASGLLSRIPIIQEDELSIASRAIQQSHKGEFIVGRDIEISDGEKIVVPPIIVNPEYSWPGGRATLSEYLGNGAFVFSVNAIVAFLLTFPEISGKNKMSRRDFLLKSGTLAVLGSSLTHLIFEYVAPMLAVQYRGTDAYYDTKNNPFPAAVRAIGQFYADFNKCHQKGIPVLDLADIKTSEKENYQEKRFRVNFSERDSILGPDEVVVTIPNNSANRQLDFLVSSYQNPSAVASSPEMLLARTSEHDIVTTAFFSAILRHTDLLNITDRYGNKEEYEFSSLAYGSAVPYLDQRVIEDQIMINLMRFYSGDQNPFYTGDLSIRFNKPESAKYQPWIAITSDGNLELVPFENGNGSFDFLVESIKRGKYRQAIQSLIAFESREVESDFSRNIQLLEDMLSGHRHDKATLNGVLYNPETHEKLFIDAPCSMELNPAQLYYITRQVADSFGWQDFVYYMGDLAGGTGTWRKENDVISSSYTAWVPNIRRKVRRKKNRETGEERIRIDWNPLLATHTHVGGLALRL